MTHDPLPTSAATFDPGPLARRRAPGGPDREAYLAHIIGRAARDLRGDKLPSLVACDLEDALSWDVDPEKCAHPRWSARNYDPSVICRTCGCPTCGESWAQPRTNTYGPPMPGLECPDDWHFANWREDDDDAG